MEFFSEIFLGVSCEQDENICQRKITSKNVEWNLEKLVSYRWLYIMINYDMSPNVTMLNETFLWFNFMSFNDIVWKSSGWNLIPFL